MLVFLAIVAILVVSFLATALILKGIIVVLGLMGVTAIGGIALVFTWKFAFLFWLLCCLIRMLFGRSGSSD